MHRFFLTLARAMALAGGAMLLLLILMTCVSILGRELNEILQADGLRSSAIGRWLLDELGVGAIDGDFELLEAGMAFTIFAFLPLTQITLGHASVDVFADRLPPAWNRWFAVVIEVVFAAVLILIAWQLFLGMLSKLNSGQTTMRLEFPVWWSYLLAVPPAFQAATTAIWCAWARLVEARTGRIILTEAEGGH
ncbi:TRAP transporter small permease [Jannaschia aquimarina]|uniref:TRAP transporter small permease protein n=1 Tax=Jannaschia aquimarina TaxID=935700 RepID=A0A0D1D4J2_9RHOB|nr:TRAP transporter small permease [Jannaschia aquimarina]KIT14988.1 Tripartite ATP-independent periplasmic transporter, DctQ component [Jannaschia aquimarina]SNS61303.1 Tripartite ATP-independent transporter, DctQ component [Jannaschia aquimarina]